MRALHYRYLDTNGETHAVKLTLRAAAAAERAAKGRTLDQLLDGSIDDRLAIIHAAYMDDDAIDAGAKKLLEDWKLTVVEWSFDGAEESAIPPLSLAERQSRGLIDLPGLVG